MFRIVISFWFVDEEAQSSDESVWVHLTIHSQDLLSIFYLLIFPVHLSFFLIEVFFADLLGDELVPVVVDSDTVVGLLGLLLIVEDLEAHLADLELWQVFIAKWLEFTEMNIPCTLLVEALLTICKGQSNALECRVVCLFELDQSQMHVWFAFLLWWALEWVFISYDLLP